MKQEIRRAFVAALAFTAAALASQSANARTLKTIYDFCAQANCADGKYAGSPLLMSGQTFYGTTGRGGSGAWASEGVVYKMTLDGMTGQGSVTVLHDFCAETNCADGANPYTTLVRDKLGNLFGTTVHGGVFCAPSSLGCGTVFALIFNKTTRTYKHKVLHVFCTDGAGCVDGSFPTGLVMDKDGNLYGVTTGGETNGDYGTVFKLTPKNDAHTSWAFKVIYKFCDKTCDGQAPLGGLVMDAAGNLYGTTYWNSGGAFALMLDKSTGKYTYKVLHHFCQKQPDCTDGSVPTLGLALDSAGNLYGTTRDGGAKNDGTVFKLTPNASKTAWTHKVIHDFCSKPDCADGSGPYTNLLIDKNGNLFGASKTATGNANGGSIFQLTPNAKQTGYSFKSLARFCTENNCADGTFSGDTSGLTMDAAGNLFLPLLDRGAHQDSQHNDAGSVLELLND